jgi:hypothetical protein
VESLIRSPLTDPQFALEKKKLLLEKKTKKKGEFRAGLYQPLFFRLGCSRRRSCNL